ncbi:FRG domain-containing protein [Paenibacillus sp. 2RAB27]|uniref:FRG domain-containing protein n=1 Tax=Paenibacillus sp. 2RAB27 TaxID=3232991 RepID=UPI003F986735
MNWNGVIQEVRSFKDLNGDDKHIWYRGHSDVNYKLTSSLFRKNFSTIKKYLIRERAIYNLFMNLGHMYHNLDDWDLIYLMQHHGASTRLLDWTESFAVSLFFATLGWKENEPISIWLLKPNELNFKTFKNHKYFTTHNDSYFKRMSDVHEEKFFKNSIALHPKRSNSRILAQQGVFTIQGNTKETLDEEFNGDLLKEGILKEIIIDYELKEDVMSFLNLSGVNSYTIFPDLYGLAKHINNLTEFNQFIDQNSN